jgi:hypothetical protein
MRWLQCPSRSNLDNCTMCAVKLVDISERENRKHLKGIIYDQKQIIRTITSELCIATSVNLRKVASLSVIQRRGEE